MPKQLTPLAISVLVLGTVHAPDPPIGIVGGLGSLVAVFAQMWMI